MLITGGGGFLGRQLVRASEHDRWQLVAPPHSMLDIRDRKGTVESLRDWMPAVVVNLPAAVSDRRRIIDGARNIAVAADRAKVRLIHVSTDSVFAGRWAPYSEDDQPDPISEEGIWRGEAERHVLDYHPAPLILRTSLVYGTARLSPIQRDIEAVCRGSSHEKFFIDEIRCPTHADDVARAISTVAGWKQVTGVLNVAAERPLNRVELARIMAAWMGEDPRVIQASTIADSGQTRAKRVVLDSRRAADYGIRCRSVDEWLSDSE